MEFTASQKEELEKKIVDIITASLEQSKIHEEDLSPISSFVLDRIDGIKTHDELMNFLMHLSARWPIFEGLKDVEKGQQDQQVDQKVAGQVEQLVESGKIDEALNLAKQATNS